MLNPENSQKVRISTSGIVKNSKARQRKNRTTTKTYSIVITFQGIDKQYDRFISNFGGENFVDRRKYYMRKQKQNISPTKRQQTLLILLLNNTGLKFS
jgi:predicted metal-dependent hydrolase